MVRIPIGQVIIWMMLTDKKNTKKQTIQPNIKGQIHHNGSMGYMLKSVRLLLVLQHVMSDNNIYKIKIFCEVYLMYNSFIFKKHSQQEQSDQQRNRQHKKWINKYQNNIRPALIEKYSRRINNFVVRLEEDKKELYQYRQETQAKAHELLKEIYRKEQFLGDPHIKLRDNKDWSSILTTTDRMEKEKNKHIFQSKYGDSGVAFRSIASQSAYNSSASNQFRSRNKNLEIHSRNMRFSTRSESFCNNKKDRHHHQKRTQSSAKAEELYLPRRLMSNHTNPSGDEQRSRAHSVFSFGGDYREDVEESASNNKQPALQTIKQPNNSKVYFKQIVDLEQNTKDPSIRKALHQILVRFGVSRIKDIKKQAMVETDNLESDDF